MIAELGDRCTRLQAHAEELQSAAAQQPATTSSVEALELILKLEAAQDTIDGQVLLLAQRAGELKEARSINGAFVDKVMAAFRLDPGYYTDDALSGIEATLRREFKAA
jgi:hypothetical protein